jgi:hypothetical protein
MSPRAKAWPWLKNKYPAAWCDNNIVNNNAFYFKQGVSNIYVVSDGGITGRRYE